MMPQSPSKNLCLKCKGRLWCGPSCRILEKHSNLKRSTELIKGNSFEGSSPPSLFVSWSNYPKVSVAPLSPPTIENDADLLDNPERWFGLSDSEIISFRETLIRSNASFDVYSASNPSVRLQTIQELAMAEKPAIVDVTLKSKPLARLDFSDSFAPMGPSAPLLDFSLASNPKIPDKIEYLVSDTDVKSLDAMLELYSSGIPVHSLYKLLSAGLLGVQKNRKLTPTRWSITAVDSNLSDSMVERIKDFPTIDLIQLFHSSFLDNHFFVLLLPETWSFEQLEAWRPGGLWTESEKEPQIMADFEPFKGRTTYADNVAGAYYSARLAVCEYLMRQKRQASAVIFREIGSGYRQPLGVWVIRQTVRNALEKKPLAFFDLSLALRYLGGKLTVPIHFWKSKSKLLDFSQNQKKLSDFS